MNLFQDIEAPKDQSPIEPLGVEPTAPMALSFSIDERAKLKLAMKDYYGKDVKASNYSDFFLTLIDLYIDENTDS